MLSGNEWVVVGWVAGCLGFLVLLKAVSGMPFFPQLRKIVGGYDPDYPKPPLAEDETIVREDRATFMKGMFGGRCGAIVLTNRRIIWGEDSSYTWPMKRISGEVNLSDLSAADKSWPIEHIFGGQRLRLRLRSGKNKCLWVDGLDEWVQAIQVAIAGAR